MFDQKIFNGGGGVRGVELCPSPRGDQLAPLQEGVHVGHFGGATEFGEGPPPRSEKNFFIGNALKMI